MRRHRLIPIAVAALVLTCATSARADGPIGLTGGLTRSTLFDASGWSGGLGYRFGASITLPLGAGIWFEPEIAWSRRTTLAQAFTQNGEPLQSRIALQYVEVPILVKGCLSRRWRVAPLVLGGVYYAANVSADVRTEFAGTKFDENVRSEVKRSDAGWIAGGGVQVRQGRRTWAMEVRYVAGVPNIYAGDGIGRWRTRSLTTTVGMKW